jgi:hypothetical protein
MEVLVNLSTQERGSPVAESTLETGELGFGPATSQPLLRRQLVGAAALAAAIALFSGLAALREPFDAKLPAQSVASARGETEVPPILDERGR